MDKLDEINSQFAVLDQVPIGMFVLDKQFVVLFWNRVLEDWTGIMRGDIVGESVETYFPHLQKPLYAGRLRPIFEGGPPAIFSSQLHKSIIPAIHPDGSDRIQHTTVTAVASLYTCHYLALFAIQDVTDLTNRIKDYRLMRDQALVEVTQREQAQAQLKAYAAELERSNDALEQLAAIASHDLREPLRKIKTFSERLQTRYSHNLDVRGLDYLQRIQHAADRMQILIIDLLAYSRVTTKARPFMPVNLTDVMEDVLSNLEIQIEELEADVQIGKLPTIEADSTQIRQLLQNLVSNALKFHQQNQRPVIRIMSRILPKAAEQTEWCELTIQDNGIGFDEKYLDSIFGLFNRLHGRYAYEGTGVGLAICQKIVVRHGGTITAHSKEGEGSTFLVTLPLKQVN